MWLGSARIGAGSGSGFSQQLAGAVATLLTAVGRGRQPVGCICHEDNLGHQMLIRTTSGANHVLVYCQLSDPSLTSANKTLM